ncbi:OpgC domain-containing protein [Oleisolibacter albus]|uniref:OpgC domain-containing protein n=1 Tax=Oleisolibacter albus TaxID=2171757 RepID=UPI000DF4634C|nr:OpgC domain-containing protein [Oleisolibacter albus]
MRRIDILDGLRGYFLVFMLFHHLPFAGAQNLAMASHAGLGYVQDAQGFVFLSGLVLGLMGARQAARGQVDRFTARTRARAWELWQQSLLLLAVLVTAAVAAPAVGQAWQVYIPDLWSNPGSVVTAAALMLYQPSLMDILPQYILYLLAAPALLRLILAGHTAAVLAGSLGVWAAVQLGWHFPLMTAMDALLDGVLPGAYLKGHFNPLAWQLLFVAGLALGALTGAGRLDWGRLPERSLPLRLALGVLAVFALYRLLWGMDWLGPAQADRFIRHADRTELGLLLVVNFLALAYVVTWLFLAGPVSRHRPVQRLAGSLRALFGWTPLTLLGRHSLQIYLAHVLLVYAAAALEGWRGPLSVPAGAVAALGGVGLLFALAWLRERRQERRRAMMA